MIVVYEIQQFTAPNQNSQVNEVKDKILINKATLPSCQSTNTNILDKYLRL